MSYGRADGINETDLQPFLAISVEIGCGLKLKKSLGVKLIFLSAYFCRSLATASSPGIPIALPDRSSCNRRFASVAQRPWIPIFCCVQTLNKAVSKQCSRFTRKRKSLICNIFYAHVHNERIPMNSADGKGRIFLLPTTQAQRPGPRGRSIATAARWPGSLQRMVGDIFTIVAKSNQFH
jgi:hypothetical protein